jgi:DNA polymerase III subunit delta'
MQFIGNTEAVAMFKRMVDSRRLPHAFLLAGPRGVGKRTLSRHIASYAEHNDFESDLGLSDFIEHSPDEGGKIGIDTARLLKEQAFGLPSRSSYRIISVARAERLTDEAQDAMLKVVEEPAEKTVIIFSTHDIAGIIPTLRSRLQTFWLISTGEEEVSAWLEYLGADKKDSSSAAARSFGRPGAAWRFLYDEKYRQMRENAEKLLETNDIKGHIAALAGEDDFSLRDYLEALSDVVLWKNKKVNPAGWHKLMKAAERSSRTTLNTKLHLADIVAALK